MSSDSPTRAVLFIIDGLHWEAPERLGLSNFLELSGEGSRVRKACLLAPYHPTSGDWAEHYTSSMPNPILLAGTLFIQPPQRLFQDIFFPDQLTAHATSSTSYTSIDPGNSLTYQASGADAEAVAWAEKFMQHADVRFLRLHLQELGDAGYQSSVVEDSVPWKRNIWAEDSPYVRTARQADLLLGRFVEFLKQEDLWEETLLVVTSDHGQVSEGWHPALAEDSWFTPLLFVGPGVESDREIEYAEHTDIIPTMAHFLDVDPPSQGPGSGRALQEIFVDGRDPLEQSQWTLRINETLRDYAALRSRLTLAARDNSYLETLLLLQEREFFGLDRFLEWHRAGSLEELYQTNRQVIDRLEKALAEAGTD